MTGAELRRRRKALGLTQTALGAILSVRQPTIARWETGALPIERPGMLDAALAHLEQRAAEDAPRTDAP